MDGWSHLLIIPETKPAAGRHAGGLSLAESVQVDLAELRQDYRVLKFARREIARAVARVAQ
jgi:hypothetical protein